MEVWRSLKVQFDDPRTEVASEVQISDCSDHWISTNHGCREWRWMTHIKSFEANAFETKPVLLLWWWVLQKNMRSWWAWTCQFMNCEVARVALETLHQVVNLHQIPRSPGFSRRAWAAVVAERLEQVRPWRRSLEFLWIFPICLTWNRWITCLSFQTAESSLRLICLHPHLPPFVDV